METTVSKFTVLFEDPFWIGLYEREENGKYEVCRITFGAEPKDCEIYDFMLKHWSTLKFSPPITAQKQIHRHINPKRMQRLIHKEVQTSAIGTKAQQALKLQTEQGKSTRKEKAREKREDEIRRRFELRRNKRKEKHRGH